MNQEGVLILNYLKKRAYARTPLQKGYGRPVGRPAGRSFAGKTIDFDVVTLAPNIAHVHSHSGTPKRSAPHKSPFVGIELMVLSHIT